MKNVFRSVSILSASLLMLVMMPLPAFAASSATSSTTSNSIGANPRKDYTMAPGETKKDTVMIHNLDPKNPLNISIGVIDFESSGQSGAPKLLVARTEPTAWSLKPYLTIQKSATIAPGAYANIPITITIPKTLGAGSYYSAIQYATGGADALQSNGSLGLSATEGTLVFVRVSGKANDVLIMKNFGAFIPNKDFSDGTYQTFYGSSVPKYLSYTLENRGNVADEPTGSIEITNLFGKRYSILPNLNPNHSLVLLGQTRRIDVCIKAPSDAVLTPTPDSTENLNKCQSPSLFPGRYTAKIDLLYGDNGSSSNEITGTSSFWYIPAWSIIALLVILAILATIGWIVWNALQNIRGHKYRRR